MSEQDKEESSVGPGMLWLLTPIAEEQAEDNDDNTGCGCSLLGLAALLAVVAFLTLRQSRPPI